MSNINANLGSVRLSDIINQYRYSLEAINRSPKTISWYMDILNRYISFLDTRGLFNTVDKLGKRELRAYIKHLQNSPRWENNLHIRKDAGKLSPYSIQGHVRAIKAFWSWLLTEGYLEENTLSKFPLPKVPRTLVKTITLEQFKMLLSQIDRSTANGAKYYCILLVLIDAGLRVSELAKIRIEDVDLHYNCIRVMGKGLKERTVPISNITRRELIRYLNNSRPNLCSMECKYLFANKDDGAISINSIQQFLKRLLIKAGLGEVKCSPHILRHTFATRSLANGANVLVLRDIMGHESLMTTMKYAHLQPRDLQQQHAKFSPVAELFANRS